LTLYQVLEKVSIARDLGEDDDPPINLNAASLDLITSRDQNGSGADGLDFVLNEVLPDTATESQKANSLQKDLNNVVAPVRFGRA